MPVIFIDADACPVRDETYRVAERYGLSVFVVTNGTLTPPRAPNIRIVLVDYGPDAADDWIVERMAAGDICITADIPLAARCLDKGGHALSPTGRPFTADNIGQALAMRSLSAHLREIGAASGGPQPLGKQDRSRFLSALDSLVQAVRRKQP